MLRTQSRDQHVTDAASLRVQAWGLTIPDAEPRLTFDKSPVRESRTPGSVGEALSSQRLYPTGDADLSQEKHGGCLLTGHVVSGV